MLISKYKYRVLYKAICIVLIHAFFVSNLAFAIERPTTHTLAAASQLWQQEFKEEAVRVRLEEMREFYRDLDISPHTAEPDLVDEERRLRAELGLPVGEGIPEPASEANHPIVQPVNLDEWQEMVNAIEPESQKFLEESYGTVQLRNLDPEGIAERDAFEQRASNALSEKADALRKLIREIFAPLGEHAGPITPEVLSAIYSPRAAEFQRHMAEYKIIHLQIRTLNVARFGYSVEQYAQLIESLEAMACERMCNFIFNELTKSGLIDRDRIEIVKGFYVNLADKKANPHYWIEIDGMTLFCNTYAQFEDKFRGQALIISTDERVEKHLYRNAKEFNDLPPQTEPTSESALGQQRRRKTDYEQWELGAMDHSDEFQEDGMVTAADSAISATSSAGSVETLFGNKNLQEASQSLRLMAEVFGKAKQIGSLDDIRRMNRFEFLQGLGGKKITSGGLLKVLYPLFAVNAAYWEQIKAIRSGDASIEVDSYLQMFAEAEEIDGEGIYYSEYGINNEELFKNLFNSEKMKYNKAGFLHELFEVRCKNFGFKDDNYAKTWLRYLRHEHPLVLEGELRFARILSSEEFGFSRRRIKEVLKRLEAKQEEYRGEGKAEEVAILSKIKQDLKRLLDESLTDAFYQTSLDIWNSIKTTPEPMSEQQRRRKTDYEQWELGAMDHSDEFQQSGKVSNSGAKAIAQEPSVLSKREKDNILSLKPSTVPRREDGAEVQLFGGYDTNRIFGCGDDYILRNFPSPKAPKDLFADKSVLVVPAYGNLPFSLKKLGAKNVVGVDKDPTLIALQKARARYGKYKSLKKSFETVVETRLSNANQMEVLVEKLQMMVMADGEDAPDLSLDGISFMQGDLSKELPLDAHTFDFIVVPYVFEISNGIRGAEAYKKVFKELLRLLKPGGNILVVPAKIPMSENKGLSHPAYKEDIRRFATFTKWLERQEDFDVEFSDKFKLYGAISIKKPVYGHYALIKPAAKPTPEPALKTSTGKEAKGLLIFDLDDTLFNSKELSAQYDRAWIDVLAENLNISYRQAGQKLAELMIEKGIKSRANLFRSIGIDPELVWSKTRKIKFENYVKPHPKLDSLLSRLGKKYVMVIATNGERKAAEKVISCLGIGRHFKRMYTSDEIGASKPNPKVFKKTLRDFPFSPLRTISIGDRWANDLEPAIQLGMKVIEVKSIKDLVDNLEEKIDGCLPEQPYPSGTPEPASEENSAGISWSLKGYSLKQGRKTIRYKEDKKTLDQLIFDMLKWHYKLPELIIKKWKKIKVILPHDAQNIVMDRKKIYYISRAFRHFFQNAYRYNKNRENPDITIRMLCDSNGSLTVQIEDKGIGISQEEISSVMDTTQENYRATNGRAHHKSEGSGFNSAHTIVRDCLNGELRLESKLGEGTIVTMEIPNAVYAPESEGIHALTFDDNVKILQAKKETSIDFIAIGKDGMKGYRKGTDQHKALNPLIVSLRRYCKKKGINFVCGNKTKVRDKVVEWKSKDRNARGIVLDSEASINKLVAKFDKLKMGDLEKDKNILLADIDNKNLEEDSYMRLMEMLSLTLELLRKGIKDEKALEEKYKHLGFKKKAPSRISFEPDAAPMEYEELRSMYKPQIFA